MSKRNPNCPNINLSTDYGQTLFKAIKSAVSDVTGPEIYLASQTIDPSYVPATDEEYIEALIDAVKTVKSNRQLAIKKANLNEAKSAADAIRPTIESFSYTAEDLRKEDILTAVYPNITDRIAMVKTISNMFSGTITASMNRIIQYLQEINDPDNAATLEKLTKGNAEQRRLAFLNFFNKVYDQSFVEWFIDELKEAATLFNNFSKEIDVNADSTDESLQRAINAAINFVRPNQDLDFGEDVINPDDNTIVAYIRNAFSKRIKVNQSSSRKAVAEKWKNPEDLGIRCFGFIQNVAEQLNNIVGDDMAIMKALFHEAAMDISFRENLDINFEDAKISKSEESTNADDATQTPNAVEDGEGGDSGQTGLGIVNYHILDPAKSLSIRMKKLLGQCYQLDSKGRPISDALGLPSYLNPSQVFYELLHDFSSMYAADEFNDFLAKEEKKYPWFKQVADAIRNDESIRNEFYKTMRRQFVASYRITDEGTLMALNQDNGVQTLMHEVTKNYEGKRQLGKTMNIKGSVWNFSIYDELGKPNINAIDKINEVLRREKTDPKTKKVTKAGGVEHAISVLQNKSLWGKDYEELRNAVAYLHGEHPQSTSVMDLLAAVGVDPMNVDVNAILPVIPEEATAKDIEEYMNAQKDMINDLRSILSIIHNIANTFKESNQHLTEGKCRSLYTGLASKISMASSPYDSVTYRSCGNTRSSYTPPTMIGDFVNAVKSAEAFKKYMDNEYMQYDFFKRPDGKCSNAWLRAIQSDPRLRQSVQLVQTLELLGNDPFKNTVGKADANTFMTAIISSFFANQESVGRVGDADIMTTVFYNPLYSDVDAMQGLRMPMFSPRQCVTALTDIVECEVDRILACIHNKQGYDIQFYNSNGRKFCFMPQLNSFKLNNKTLLEALNDVEGTEERKAVMRQYVDDVMDDNFYNFIESANGILADKIIKESIQAKMSDPEDEINPDEIKAKQAEFYYNFFNGQIQWMQMFSGDLAYYKNFDDYVKRAKEMYACGERGYFIDESGNHIMETAVYIDDAEHASLEFKNIEDVLMSSSDISPLERDLYRGQLYNYMSITEADGQSYRTVESFRTIYKGLGMWNDECEEAFNIITNDDTSQSSKIKPLMFLLQTLKSFMITHESLNVNGRNEKVYVQHKNSEYALSAAYSMINSVFNNSPKMVAIQKYMKENGIDVIHFNSCTKHGYPKNGAFNLNFNNAAFERLNADKNHPASRYVSAKQYYEAITDAMQNGKITQDFYNKLYNEITFNKSERNEATLKKAVDECMAQMEAQADVMKKNFGIEATHQYDLNDMMIVQPTADHLIGEEGEAEMALFGSQLRNVLYADFTDDMMHEFSFGNGQKVNMSMTEGRKLYDALITNQLLGSFAKVNDKFTDPQKLEKFLQSQMSNGQQYSDDVKKALTLDEDGNFRIPLNAPNIRNKVEALLLSAFKNAIQKQKIRGGSAILVSSFGLSDDLKIDWKDPNDKSKGYNAMEVYLPATFQEAYRDCVIDEIGDDGKPTGLKLLDMNELKRRDVNHNMLEGIAYRIPTEDKYSAMIFRVKGFLPVSMGSNIIMPREVITMSGTDFDVDKMFLMLRDFDRVKAGPAMSSAGTTDEDIKAYEAYKAAGNAITKDNIKILKASDNFKKFQAEHKKDFTIKYKTYTSDVKFDSDGKVDPMATARMDGIAPKQRAATRNNMLIDMAANALGSSHGSHINFQTGQYETLKAASRMERILHDVDARKEFLDKYCGGSMKNLSQAIHKMMADDVNDVKGGKSPYTTLNEIADKSVAKSIPGDFGDYVDKHMNLMAGNDLIGIFAVNSSCHYKYQTLGLKLPVGRKVKFFGRELDDVDPVTSPINGRRIGNIMAELQAAAPDNGKDPVLGDCNANNNTAARMGFLAALGMDPIDITLINDKVVEDIMLTPTFAEAEEPIEFDGNINRLVELSYKASENPEDLTIAERNELAGMTQWYANIDECAAFRKQSQCISRCDSQNGSLAISTSDAIVQREKALEFSNLAKSSMAPISGFDRFIDVNIDYNDESTWPKNYAEAEGTHDEKFLKMMNDMGRMQAYYTLGHRSAMNLASKYLKNLQTPMLKAVDMLKYMGGVRYFTTSRQATAMRNFLNDFATYALMSMPMISERVTGQTLKDVRDYYIHDFPMKLNMLINAKDEEGKMLHPDLKTPIIDRLTIKSGGGITASSINKTTELIRTMLTKSFDALSASDDPVVRDTVTDMILYEIFNDGLNYNPSGYGIFASCDLIDRVTNGEFSEALTRTMDSILQSNEKTTKFIDQFLHNHSKDAVRNFSTKSQSKPFHFMERSDAERDKGIPVAIVFDGKEHNKHVQRIGIDGNMGYLDYINIDGQLFSLDKTRSNGEDAVYIQENVKSKDTPEFYDPNATETIDYSTLADYGVVLGTKSMQSAEEAIKKEEAAPQSKEKAPTIDNAGQDELPQNGLTEEDYAAQYDERQNPEDPDVAVQLGDDVLSNDQQSFDMEAYNKLKLRLESVNKEIAMLTAQGKPVPQTLTDMQKEYEDNLGQFCIFS